MKRIEDWTWKDTAKIILLAALIYIIVYSLAWLMGN
jgi:hypothetical protein